MSRHPAVAPHVTEHRPAGGVGWVLPFYDRLSRAAGVGRVHERLLHGAAVEPGHAVLDVGCGTGSLTVMAKHREPAATLVGLDPDPAALERAAAKADDHRLDIQWDVGFGGCLPYPDGSFDRVLSAFVLHHMPASERAQTLAEVRRVLRPHGSVHLVDFAQPEDLADLLRCAGYPRGTMCRGTVLSVMPVGIVRSYI